VKEIIHNIISASANAEEEAAETCEGERAEEEGKEEG